MAEYPKTFRVRQHLEARRVDDLPGEVHAQLARLRLGERVRPGQRVAVAVGSRGIANLQAIVRAIVEHLKQLGAEPFVVPAMGSHGGGTAEGQRELLRGYGITPEGVGCPIRASMETVVVCQTAEGFPVHFDRLAYEADHVVVCNRIKPHTDFAGRIESGLMKMLLIGLGKCEGAIVYHRAIQDYNFAQIIRSVAGEVFRQCSILAGVAIVENAYDETALVEAVAPAEFESREEELLVLAKQWMPRLPFREVDVLLIDRIGKNISGTGMDTNAVGRKYNDHRATEGEWPKVRRICVRGLTPETHGNAVGMGIAEFCKSSLLSQADLAVTRLNGLVSGHIAAAMPPLDYATDREMLTQALGTIGLREPCDARLLWISDTLHLAEVECAEAYLEEAQRREDLEVLTGLRELPFDGQGNLPDRATC
jgi:hypothetical protein